MADGSATGLSYATFDLSQGASTIAANQLSNTNQQYQSFLQNLPQYQANLNNQAIDQGNTQYNNQKQQIDQTANSRGLLYSGLKTGAESAAANNAANGTQNQIASNNANLSNYANQYGQQVAGANIGNYNSQVQNSLNNQNYNMGQYQQNANMVGGLLGGIGSLGALAFMASDKKLKDNVKDADDDALEMVDKLGTKSFSYKADPEKKEQLGILAQDLEKSPMGKALVVETPAGKGVDIAKALSAVMAVQSMLHKRLKKAEAS